MVDIPEQAVKAGHDGLPPSRQLYIDHNDVREILTAAAPYMQGSARDQALEEAARIARHFGELAYSEGMSEDVVMARSYMARDIEDAIRALKSQPAQTGSGE